MTNWVTKSYASVLGDKMNYSSFRLFPRDEFCAHNYCEISKKVAESSGLYLAKHCLLGFPTQSRPPLFFSCKK